MHIIIFHVVTSKRFLCSAPHTFCKYILLVGGTNTYQFEWVFSTVYKRVLNTMLIFFTFTFCLLPRALAITVISMKESMEAFNKPSGARVRNLNLTELSELTICIRVFFYQFPIRSTSYYIKWFPILSTSGDDFLFNVIADKTANSSIQRSNLITEKDHNKDLRAYVSINGNFTQISDVNPYSLRSWNNLCIYGRKINPLFEIFINGKVWFSANEFPELEISNSESLMVFGKKYRQIEFTTYGKFSDLNVYDKILSLDELVRWTKQQSMETEAMLRWNEINMELENLEREEFQRINFTENMETLFMFHDLNFNEAIRRCQSFGGAIATPLENIDLDVWENKVRADGQVDRMWLGYRRGSKRRSNFYNIYKIRKNICTTKRSRTNRYDKLILMYPGSVAKWQDWEPGQPNDWGGLEDCVQYDEATGKIRDDTCDTKEAAENDVTLI